MFPAAAAAVKPGDWVLDLCAAPGGKATQLAGMLGQEGVLVANEIHPKRAKILSENIERAGVRNALVTQAAPQKLAEHFVQAFDVIVVDAPCSGEGMFRKDEEARAQWSQALVDECAQRQREILSTSLRMLKPGGRLVYSTCTFAPEENEKMIEWLLASHEELQMVPIACVGGMESARSAWGGDRHEVAQAVRFWPQHVRGEGHFVAVLEKSATVPLIAAAPKKVQPSRLNAEQRQLWQAFISATFTENLPGVLVLQGNHLHLIPEDFPDFSGLHVLRTGVHAGEFKKNRFEPNHALALAYPNALYKQSLAIDFENYRRYVQGLTFDVTTAAKGWTQIKIHELPLGWGKVVQGTVKNFFPKGLRFQMFY